MPFQLLDVALIAIMLISALFAVMRGFTREVLSLAAWVIAALAAWWAINTQELVDIARSYIAQEKVAVLATAGAVFLIVLIIMSIISVRIGDLVLDSAVGAVDRTLGLLYGLVRGLLLVVVAYMFYVWLIPVDKQEDWVTKARTLPLIRATAEFVNGFLPPDIGKVIGDKLALQAALTENAGKGDKGGPAYDRSDKTRLDSLIESQQNRVPGSQ
ncbi:CvpA family protein [Thermopetrobacter sp. TC1]|uniref:CvpA family protein n=1 Tax=Thermopetrobacter sp. TC1 TaxID=1495045 RepID=UPI00056E761D|nr:CvpA family protein [Thermopetrobacter sp. TC1]